eukprot:6714656-Pyramimonas_sp.AAC.1
MDRGGRGTACEACCRGPRWSSLRGHELDEGCADMDLWWAENRMRTLLLGPSVELPMGPRTV